MELHLIFYHCVVFMDGNKIQMQRQGGYASLQSSVYSGKNIHCLVYQTILTRDGFIIPIYGPEVGQKHYITFLGTVPWILG